MLYLHGTLFWLVYDSSLVEVFYAYKSPWVIGITLWFTSMVSTRVSFLQRRAIIILGMLELARKCVVRVGTLLRVGLGLWKELQNDVHNFELTYCIIYSFQTKIQGCGTSKARKRDFEWHTVIRTKTVLNEQASRGTFLQIISPNEWREPNVQMKHFPHVI